MKKQVEDFIDTLKYVFEVEVDSFSRPDEDEPAYQVCLKTQVPEQSLALAISEQLIGISLRRPLRGTMSILISLRLKVKEFGLT